MGHHKKSKDPLTHVLNGACSGVLGACVVQPLDVVRTRQQLGQFKELEGLGKVRSASHLSTYRAARFIIQGEGVGALWNGLSASLYRVVPGAGMYFGLLHVAREKVKEHYHTDNLNASQSFLTGSAARFAVSCVLHPVSVIKTRMEALVHTPALKPPSPLQMMADLIKGEGRGAMFSGFTATVIRDVPTAGLYLAFYEESKNALFAVFPGMERTPTPIFTAAAIIAGVGSTVITHPPDVIKTRLQLQKHEKGSGNTLERRMYKNSLDVIRHVVREEGIAGLYRGLLPRLIRKPIMFALTWTTYEVLVRVKGETTTDDDDAVS